MIGASREAAALRTAAGLRSARAQAPGEQNPEERNLHLDLDGCRLDRTKLNRRRVSSPGRRCWRGPAG